jgi:hypothetical protein
MPKVSKRAQVSEVRREYERAKRARNRAGKLARGKPEHSKIKKDYRTLDRYYHRVGNQLGRLTGAR